MSSPAQTKKKYCVLQSSAENSCFKGVDPPCTPEIYMPEHEFTNVLLEKATVNSTILKLAREGFDCFINLCDGSWDEDRVGIEACDMLARLDLPFTGADRRFFDPSRLQMKKVALACGHKTPFWKFVYHQSDLDDIVGNLSFPLIVKHYNSYSSIGLTRKSCVYTPEDLLEQARIMIEAFGGCLVEEFIIGREFTVLVAENPDDPTAPITFAPVECRFPDGETFKHYDLKWINFEGIQWVLVENSDLDRRLRDMASKVFAGMHGRGFGRIDVRSDQSGDNIYFLEMNPNCGIFYPAEAFGSADTILQLDTSTSHRAFLELLIKCAHNSRSKAQPIYRSIYRKNRGFGLFATRDIPAGAIVERNEEKATVIASRRHIDASFSAAKMADFFAYGWPLSEQTWVTWSEDPDEWAPINHSCTPNTWLNGLNLVACRDIRKNEELTVEYATFCVDATPFDCSCGSVSDSATALRMFFQTNCRGLITGRDWARPEVVAKYFPDHVSGHVYTLQRALSAKQPIAASDSTESAAEVERLKVVFWRVRGHCGGYRPNSRTLVASWSLACSSALLGCQISQGGVCISSAAVLLAIAASLWVAKPRAH